MIPGSDRSKGPSHLKIRQAGSYRTPEGTLASRQTMDNSSGVRAIDTKCPLLAHSGISVFESSLQIAYRSGRTASVSSALGFITVDPFLGLRRRITGHKIQKPARIGLLDNEPPVRRVNEPFVDPSIE